MKRVFAFSISITVVFLSIVEVREGKISRCKDYYDFATVMRQTGQLPEEKK